MRVLGYAYALVSAGGPAETEWCSLDGIPTHAEIAVEFTRLDSKAGSRQRANLVDADAAIRAERHRLSLQAPDLSLEGTNPN